MYQSDGLPRMGDDYETQLENLMTNETPNPQTGAQGSSLLEPGAPDDIHHIKLEHWELDKKGMLLTKFIRDNPRFPTLPVRERQLLAMQAKTMADYFSILTERLWRAENPALREEADAAAAEKEKVAQDTLNQMPSGGHNALDP